MNGCHIRRINMKALATYQIILLGEQRHTGLNNLPKVVAWQCSGRESNPRPATSRSRVRHANRCTTKPPYICVHIRVRTILALGYWVLGNIRRYWVVLLLGDIFCYCNTQYDTDQTAVSTIHMITILMSVARPLLADDRDGGERVECKLYISIIIHFWYSRGSVLYIFCSRSIHCYVTH